MIALYVFLKMLEAVLIGIGSALLVVFVAKMKAASSRRTPQEKFENIAMVAGECDEAVEGEALANAIELSDEWVQLAAFGEVAHPRGIQRIDKEACERMENSF